MFLCHGKVYHLNHAAFFHTNRIKQRKSSVITTPKSNCLQIHCQQKDRLTMDEQLQKIKEELANNEQIQTLKEEFAVPLYKGLDAKHWAFLLAMSDRELGAFVQSIVGGPPSSVEQLFTEVERDAVRVAYNEVLGAIVRSLDSPVKDDGTDGDGDGDWGGGEEEGGREVRKEKEGSGDARVKEEDCKST